MRNGQQNENTSGSSSSASITAPELFCCLVVAKKIKKNVNVCDFVHTASQTEWFSVEQELNGSDGCSRRTGVVGQSVRFSRQRKRRPSEPRLPCRILLKCGTACLVGGVCTAKGHA